MPYGPDNWPPPPTFAPSLDELAGLRLPGGFVVPPPVHEFTQAEADAANQSPVPPVAFAPVQPWDAADIEYEPPAPPIEFTDDEANPPRPMDPYADSFRADAAAKVRAAEQRPSAPRIGAELPRAVPPAGSFGATEFTPGGLPIVDVSPEPDSVETLPPGIGARALEVAQQVAAATPQSDETLTDDLHGDDTPQATEARVKGLADMYVRDPVMLAEAEASLNRRKQSEADRGVAEANEQRTQDLAMLADRREKARAAAQADMADIRQRASQMAESSPFESWWSDRSTLGKVAGFISAIAGGWMQGQGKTGGRNPAIDMMMQVAEQDANAKWQKLRERRSLAEGAIADADEDYRQEAAIKFATYEQLLRKLQSDAALIDPEGTAAIENAKAQQEVLGRMGQAQAAAEKERYARAEKAIELDQSQQQIDAENAKNADSSRLAWAKFGRQGMGTGKPAGLFGAKAVHTLAEWATIDPSMKDALARLDPTMEGSMTGADFAQFQTINSKANQAGLDVARGTRVEQEIDATDRERRIGSTVPTLVKNEDGTTALKWDVLRQADGTEFLAPNATRGAALEKQISSTTNAARIVDQILALRKKYGWSSDLVKSDEWRKMKSNFGSLTMESKDAYGLGALAGPDVEQLHQVFGTDDPTEMRDPSAGLLEMRKNLIANVNTNLRGAQYNGKKFGIPRPAASRPAPRDPDVDKASSASPTGNIVPDPIEARLTAAALGGGGIAGRVGAVAQEYVSLSPAEKERLVAGLSLPQYEGVTALVAKVRDKNDEAAAYGLDELATNPAAPPAVRRFAARSLMKLARGGNRAAMAPYSDEGGYVDDDEGDE